ncbi:hypothetical protein P171DRAFT_479591 [Karstenula rhodostoma CBS 690.94]|uniref:Uncharacterized protein n=1 Tax=Karstenula rhodostoma CBS 690.94 TaxID=1392251 RepID=A0A9P4PX91_9PLEO|nr:hypothetical protein P171DRAFT_479591 [Karstenula rhodostoma CBS 690.94]
MQFSTIFVAVAAMATGFAAARPIPILIPANAHTHHARSLDIADLWVDKRFTGINNSPSIKV